MTRPQALLLVVAGAAAVGLAGSGGPKARPWLVNETPSLPRGLYLRTPQPASAGAIVAVACPAAARPYLARLGVPSDARLLKRVAAGPGDTVCRDAHRLIWPGGQAVVLSRDRRGGALPTWRGCRRLGPGELIVVGDSVASFDSRYFGPVRLGAVEGVYREAWRW